MIHTLKTNLPSEQEPFSALEKQPRFVILTKCSFPPNRNKSRSRRACTDFCSAFLETSIQSTVSPGRFSEIQGELGSQWLRTQGHFYKPPSPHFWPHGKMFYCRRSRISCTYKFFTARLTWHLYLNCSRAGKIWQLMIWTGKAQILPKWYLFCLYIQGYVHLSNYSTSCTDKNICLQKAGNPKYTNDSHHLNMCK